MDVVFCPAGGDTAWLWGCKFRWAWTEERWCGVSRSDCFSRGSGENCRCHESVKRLLTVTQADSCVFVFAGCWLAHRDQGKWLVNTRSWSSQRTVPRKLYPASGIRSFFSWLRKWEAIWKTGVQSLQSSQHVANPFLENPIVPCSCLIDKTLCYTENKSLINISSILPTEVEIKKHDVTVWSTFSGTQFFLKENMCTIFADVLFCTCLHLQNKKKKR